MEEALFWKDMEQKTKNAPEVQKKLLNQIMQENAKTEYLQRYQGIFSNLPVVEYKDIEADILRIADGDNSPVLCSERVCRMFTSSGTTTGKSKLIPATTRSIELLFRRGYYFKESDLCFGILFTKPESTTSGGLPLSTTSTTVVRRRYLDKMFTSPLDIILAPDINQSMYCHLLCGLVRSAQVTRLYTALSKMLVEALTLLEEAWQELVDDIRNGTVSPRITDPNLRAAVSDVSQKPRPQLAARIEREIRKSSSWSGIIPRLWPKATCIVTVTTGAMQTYVPIIRKYAGGVPIVSGDYVCTESVIGFNMDPTLPPENVTFTVHPDYAFYEFLPTNSTGKCDPLGIADVKVGEEYELVVTTWAGLYRYKVGDVVKVTGFHNSSPTISFMHRVSSVLNIASEKTSEAELQKAMQSSLRLLPPHEHLVDFTSHVDGNHYVIYWELKSGNALSTVLLKNCCYVLDVSLNEKYRLARAKGEIGPLQLCLVRSKTFSAVLKHTISQGTNATQYKTPRCTNNPNLVAILRNGVMQHCQSPRFPAKLA